MIKVTNNLTVYELDGVELRDPPGAPTVTAQVLSHWNRNSLVVIDIDGKRVTVAASDLEAAIRNACNTARHG